MSRKRVYLVSLWLAVATWGAGCAESPSPVARLRVLNASADAPPLDLFVSDRPALDGSAYQEGSEFLAAEPGDHRLRLTPANRDAELVELSARLEAGRSYSLVALGRRAQLEPFLWEEDATPAAPGSVRLRCLNAHPELGALDLYVSGPAAPLAKLEPTVAGLDPRAASRAFDHPRGALRVRLTAAGRRQVLYDSGPVVLGSEPAEGRGAESEGGVASVGSASAGGGTSLVLTESLGGRSPLALVVWPQEGPPRTIPDRTARVRLLHAASTAPALDLGVGDETLLSGVAYLDSSRFLEPPAGPTAFALRTAGSTAAIHSGRLACAAGTDTTLIALGAGSDVEALVLDAPVGVPPRAGARLRVVHAAARAGALEVTVGPAELEAAEPLGGQTRFRDVGAHQEVAAGALRVRVRAPGSAALIHEQVLSLRPGALRTLVLLDPPASGGGTLRLGVLVDRP